MKKIILFYGMIAVIMLSGCKKEDAKTADGVDSKVIVAEIFKAGMAWNSEIKTLKSSYPINISVENTVSGPAGGSIHVLGSVTGSMSIDDNTGEILGGTMLIGITETINDYALMYENQKYTMNGAPYISLTGTFTLMPGGNSFGTASSMQLGGGIRVTGPGYDQTINMQITILINSNGTGGMVSGTIGGEPVNYTF